MAPRKSQSSTEQSVTYESEVVLKKEKITYILKINIVVVVEL